LHRFFHNPALTFELLRDCCARVLISIKALRILTCISNLA